MRCEGNWTVSDPSITETLTPLPGGGYAERTWSSLSWSQRSVLEIALKAVDWTLLPLAQPRTLTALARRGITTYAWNRRLTDRGIALLRWRRSPAGEAWVTAWAAEHQ